MTGLGLILLGAGMVWVGGPERPLDRLVGGLGVVLYVVGCAVLIVNP